MIIVEEVAIEGTCRQMSIKLVDSCYGILLRDHLMLHQSSSAYPVEFLCKSLLNAPSILNINGTINHSLLYVETRPPSFVGDE